MAKAMPRKPLEVPHHHGLKSASVQARTDVSPLLALQRMAGNAAVAALVEQRRRVELPAPVQRELEDQGQAGEGQLGATGAVAQPVEEGGGGGGIEVGGTNEFGEIDGYITSPVQPHVFVNKGKVATGIWIHGGGNGGRGNENVGSADLVAPAFDTKPVKSGGFKAFVRPGTGKVKVKRSWNGVPAGPNGTATWAGSGGGLIFVRSSAARRMSTHEIGHVKESKRIHDAEIKPLEKRLKATRPGADAAAAIAALQTHVDWSAAVSKFAADDSTINAPGGTWDTTDQAKANFYHDKGAKTIKGVAYGHLIEAP